MKARILWFAAVPVAAIAAVYLAGAYDEHSRREAYIYRCNEEGAGGMFTSREYCEELYARSSGRRRPTRNPN
jgi:hypothetical protein